MTTPSMQKQLAAGIYSMQLTPAETVQLALDSPLFQRRRSRQSNLDWTGQQEDVGLQLKRVGYRFPDECDDQTFGVYLGYHASAGGYVVATKQFLSLGREFSGGLVYGSISDLMQAWELD